MKQRWIYGLFGGVLVVLTGLVVAMWFSLQSLRSQVRNRLEVIEVEDREAPAGAEPGRLARPSKTLRSPQKVAALTPGVGPALAPAGGQGKVGPAGGGGPSGAGAGPGTVGGAPGGPGGAGGRPGARGRPTGAKSSPLNSHEVLPGVTAFADDERRERQPYISDPQEEFPDLYPREPAELSEDEIEEFREKAISEYRQEMAMERALEEYPMTSDEEKREALKEALLDKWRKLQVYVDENGELTPEGRTALNAASAELERRMQTILTEEQMEAYRKYLRSSPSEIAPTAEDVRKNPQMVRLALRAGLGHMFDRVQAAKKRAEEGFLTGEALEAYRKSLAQQNPQRGR